MTDQQKLELEALILPLQDACRLQNLNFIVSIGEKSSIKNGDNITVAMGKSDELSTQLSYVHYNLIRSIKGFPIE
jgi:hypothetical protein